MPSLTETGHAGGFILRDSPRSRDNVTVLSGQNLKAGAVIGKVLLAAGRAAIPAVVGTGNGLMSALFAGPEVEPGNYVVTCITAAANGGTFSVVTPKGKALPNAVVGTAYRSRHINFLISDGSTDFIVGDVFTVAVAAGAPTVVGTGNGTIVVDSLGPDAKPGRYRAECIAAVTNGGGFKLLGPDGNEIDVGYITAGAGGTLVLGQNSALRVTITDGTTDFAVGDFFEVFVYNQPGKVAAWDPTTYDGRHQAAGILYDDVDASAADASGAIVSRDAEVLVNELVYAAAITAAQKDSAQADLRKLGVIAR